MKFYLELHVYDSGNWPMCVVMQGDEVEHLRKMLDDNPDCNEVRVVRAPKHWGAEELKNYVDATLVQERGEGAPFIPIIPTKVRGH